MRDVIFSLMMFGLLPVCFRRPLIGLLAFSWLAYMRTQDLCWGFAREQRWSFLIAAVTMAGFLSRPTSGRWFVRDARCYAMIALAIWVGFSILGGRMMIPHQADIYVEYCKIIGVALFTTAVVVRREHLRVLMWVIALSFGFYGVKVGLSGVLSFGRIQVLQGPGGMLEDNNNFGLALTMALPLLLQIGLAEKNKILRRGVMITIPLTAITVLLTHSRGAFLSLCCMLAVLVWRSKNRLVGVGVALCAAVLAFAFVPKSYVERLETIQHYEQDGSAMGRLAAWKTALNMSKDNPVLGVGYGMFQSEYWRYRSGDEREGRRVAHNAYLQVLAECGMPALALYLFLIGATMWSLMRLRRDAQRLYYSSWIVNYATMFEASMVAFIIGSVFLNRAQFDLFYHFVAIVVAFERIARNEMEGLAPIEGSRARGGTLTLVQPRGFARLAPQGGFGGGAG